MTSWMICTGEYPPDCGGVGDYTALLASALVEAGDRVAVCRPAVRSPGSDRALRRVELVDLPDAFGPAGRRALARRLEVEKSRILVQYVPNAFGNRGANLAWCWWLLRRARRLGDDVRVMFHEPYLYFDWPRPHRCALAIVQRAMAAVLLRAATEVYVSTEAWHRYLRPYAPSGAAPPIILPVPSSIPLCDSADVHGRRLDLTTPTSPALAGHFGTYGALVAPLLRRALPVLLQSEPGLSFVCIGAGSDAFVRDLLAAWPAGNRRVRATGAVSPADAARSIAACDLLLQPYPDGVTTRRTSVMAALANARPVLTTAGKLTERIWTESGAVAVAPAGEPDALVSAARRLLADPPARDALARRGHALYRTHFALEHTVRTLRAEAPRTWRDGIADLPGDRGGAAA